MQKWQNTENYIFFYFIVYVFLYQVIVAYVFMMV